MTSRQIKEELEKIYQERKSWQGGKGPFDRLSVNKRELVLCKQHILCCLQEAKRIKDKQKELFYLERSIPAKVTMHNIGIVDSIGNLIFLAGEPRYAVPNSSFLFHGVGFDITQPARFEEKQLKERLKSIERDQKLTRKTLEVISRKEPLKF